jgi:hypothetical protein
MTETKCTCGAVLPYRRAYACLKCWERIKEAAGRLMRLPFKGGSGQTLSLRGEWNRVAATRRS